MNQQLKSSIRTLLIVAGVCVGTAAVAAPTSYAPPKTQPDMNTSSMNNSNVTSDSDVTKQVKSRLASMSNLQDANINVSTMAGKVTLTGTVTSKDEENAAKSAAESIPGVKKVDDDLSVSKPPKAG